MLTACSYAAHAQPGAGLHLVHSMAMTRFWFFSAYRFAQTHLTGVTQDRSQSAQIAISAVGWRQIFSYELKFMLL